MYLTDYREMSLKDVITQLEPGLFKKVTALDVKDFELLCSLGVFNANLMNQAIFSFKRYEDSSLSYTGINRHEGKDIGGWDTVIKREEYEKMFYNQQATMNITEVIKEAAEEEPEESEISLVHRSYDEKTPVSTKPLVAAASQQPYNKTETTKPVSANKPAEKKSEDGFAMPKLEEGLHVIHRKFGEGVITKVHMNDRKINVSFKDGEKSFITDEKSKDNVFRTGFLKMKDPQ